MKTKIKISLLIKVIIAIIVGLISGLFVPEPAVKFFITFNSIFSSFLSFIIPLIIMGLVVSGIADLGNKAGKLLLITVGLAYASTLFSGFLTYFSCNFFFPFIFDPEQSSIINAAKTSFSEIKPFFSLTIPPVFDVMTALSLSFVIGMGVASVNGPTIKSIFIEFKEIIEKVISVIIIPLLPLFIFGIFLNMSFNGEAIEVIKIFGRVIVLILILSVVLLLLQYFIAGLITKRNPFTLLKVMMPAYMTALGTSSSAATIPVTLAQAKKNGVTEDIADFCIPLCATIHLGGSTLKITGMSMAVLILQGQPIEFVTYAGFIFMLGITMVAAPGVPGGAIMAAVAILQTMLGFNEQAIALMIAVYIAIDSFGTACNVTGDGAIALIVDKISRN